MIYKPVLATLPCTELHEMSFAVKRTLHRLIMRVLRLLAKVINIPRPVLLTGAGSSLRLCDAVAQMGARHVLLVTDADLVSLGMPQPIVDALAGHGVETTIFDGVKPDPSYRQVERGVTVLKEAGCDAVLALGGGSPIDAAKMISVRATHDVALRKLVGFFKVRKPPLPLYAVPTTAGTGSEVTVAAVISDPETHLKTPVIDPKLVPRMAALDPGLMTGLPKAITADTGMDALTHAVEAYLSRNATAETDSLALAAVRMIFDNLPRAYADGADLAAREAMALASCYAGLAFTRASVGYIHAVAHSFGAHYNTPHGRANAIVMPHVLELSKGPAARRMAELAAALGHEAGSDAELADAFIADVRELAAKLDIPDRLASLKREDIPQIATEALREAHYNYPVPRYFSRAQCEQLLADLLAP